MRICHKLLTLVHTMCCLLDWERDISSDDWQGALPHDTTWRQTAASWIFIASWIFTHLKWWLAELSITRCYLATDSCFVNIHGRRCRPITQPLVMISDGCCRRGLHVASLFLENYFSKISGQLVHIVYGMVYQLTHSAVHAGTVNIVGTKVCQYSCCSLGCPFPVLKL